MASISPGPPGSDKNKNKGKEKGQKDFGQGDHVCLFNVLMLFYMNEGANNKARAVLPNKKEEINEIAYTIVSKKMSIITCFTSLPCKKF